MGLKKTLFAVTLGAVAGLFLAKKPGTELRGELKATAARVRKDVSKKLAELEGISRATYDEVVLDVLNYYEKAGKLTKEDVGVLKQDLGARWKEIQSVLSEKETGRGSKKTSQRKHGHK